ncbi:MAG: FxsA family protein [Rhodospirillaceae bacterium]|jgi:UPF0716 protein FxsA|nr:FxsA family protein [Rhodospirillaceae bacterium]MBT4940450.1 FxsA family protein [Rhodospirillaceae bacterium]MBT5941484.1 FxsA family protein [Rhodospirillaceae bacterium]MBT7957204.1 FxsA family protein [Rhodospirillaceae bacterium]
MGYILFILFIGIPIIEISVFISVGEIIGLWPTLATILITAIIGSALLRAQGLATLFRAQEHLNQGRFPLEEIFDGLCLVIAGAFLLTPGFVTDGVGFLLFFPPFRYFLKKAVGAMLVARGGIHVYTSGNGPEQTRSDGSIINGEFEEIDPQEQPPKQEDTDKHPIRRID